jgi:RHS repeat-associated protein
MYTGQAYEFETGLYYYHARFYSPYIGRFLQTDPVEYDSGMNLYTYCLNNPLICTDPYGLGNTSRKPTYANPGRIAESVNIDEIEEAATSMAFSSLGDSCEPYLWPKLNTDNYNYEWTGKFSISSTYRITYPNNGNAIIGKIIQNEGKWYLALFGNNLVSIADKLKRIYDIVVKKGEVDVLLPIELVSEQYFEVLTYSIENVANIYKTLRDNQDGYKIWLQFKATSKKEYYWPWDIFHLFGHHIKYTKWYEVMGGSTAWQPSRPGLPQLCYSSRNAALTAAWKYLNFYGYIGD